MENVSILPIFVTTLFRKMPNILRKDHKLVSTWLIFLCALGVGDHKLKRMGNYGSYSVTEYRFRRFLTASYWSFYIMLTWLAEEVIKVLPIPEDNTLYIIGDGSHKGKRSTKNPLAQKGKNHSHSNWFFGIRFIVLMVQWKNFRVPVDFEIIHPKSHPAYENENSLFRKMLTRFKPPRWAKRIIVLADSGYASKENMRFITEISKREKKNGVTWGFVLSLPKTWKFKNGKKLRDLARYTPKHHYKKTRFQPVTQGRSKSFWAFAKRAALEHVGDVTIVLSRKRRNSGPKATKVIVTNLTELSHRQVLSIYQRRFMIEVLFMELKSGLGLGKHQVSKNEERIKKSAGISLLAYLLILRMQHNCIEADKSWSIIKLQEKFKLRVVIGQAKHDQHLIHKKLYKAA